MVMEIKSPEQMASLGAVGCLKEAGKLILHHARLFLLIILAIPLPYFIFDRLVWRFAPIPEEHIQEFINGHIVVSPGPNILTPEDLRSMQATPYFLFGAISGLLVTSVFSLHFAVVALGVASVYDHGESKIGLVSIMRSLPAVFKRMVVTFLWTLSVSKAFTLLLTGLVSINGFLPFIERLEKVDPKIDFAIGLASRFLPHLIFAIFLIFDQYATVLESEVYGYAALVRSVTLTKRKKLTVIALETSLLILQMTPHWVFRMFADAGATNEAPKLMNVADGLLMLYTSMFHTFRFVVFAVFYFACKAFHEDMSGGPSGFYPVSKYTALPSSIT